MSCPDHTLSLFNIHYSSLFSSGYGRDYFLYYRYFRPPKTALLLINSNFCYLSNLLKHAQTLSNSSGVPILEVSISTINTESFKSGGLLAVLQGKTNDLLFCLFCQLPYKLSVLQPTAGFTNPDNTLLYQMIDLQ